MVTDAGEYRVFGLNLDNVEEAVSPIIDRAGSPLSLSGDIFRRWRFSPTSICCG